MNPRNHINKYLHFWVFAIAILFTCIPSANTFNSANSEFCGVMTMTHENHLEYISCECAYDNCTKNTTISGGTFSSKLNTNTNHESIPKSFMQSESNMQSVSATVDAPSNWYRIRYNGICLNSPINVRYNAWTLLLTFLTLNATWKVVKCFLKGKILFVSKHYFIALTVVAFAAKFFIFIIHGFYCSKASLSLLAIIEIKNFHRLITILYLLITLQKKKEKYQKPYTRKQSNPVILQVFKCTQVVVSHHRNQYRVANKVLRNILHYYSFIMLIYFLRTMFFVIGILNYVIDTLHNVYSYGTNVKSSYNNYCQEYTRVVISHHRTPYRLVNRLFRHALYYYSHVILTYFLRTIQIIKQHSIG